MEIREIKKRDDGRWVVNGEVLTTIQLVAKYCPSKTIAKDVEGWYPSILHYSIVSESPHYGWREFFDRAGIKEDYKPIDEWDKKYRILLY
ncbi:hypothetical protein IJJ36_04110 [Candidatus Saccharibacteria bacterium]|nr:hypothetical protein [Candidatus Saccharibacteria bacterium]